MENSTEFCCEISNSHPAAQLGLEIWIDKNKIFDSDHISQRRTVAYSLTEQDDDSSEHELRLVMKNKTDADTQLDEAGNVVDSAMLYITDFKFDNIDVTQLVFENSEYTHNFNGHGPTSTEKFYGHMGCNGTVSMKFTSPVYLWLLETM